MEIMNSTLGMDAKREHKDVQSATSALATTFGQGKAGEIFQLDLSRSPSALLRRDAARQSTGLRTESTVVDRGERQSHRLETLRSMVSHSVETFVGGRVGQVQLLEQPESPRQVGDKGQLAGGQTSNLDSPFTMSFVARSMRYEYEKVNFSSHGAVETADGRKIDFSLELTMERRSVSTSTFATDTASQLLLDPLVLHFETGFDLLEDTLFSFDLDGDGSLDDISTLGSGSGFLAFDSNGDAEINNGSELFGPLSGNGYEELALHDQDQNNWIDENDPIFEQLLIWKAAGSAEEQLISLKEAGVGAISLAHLGTMFELRGQSGDVLGQVKNSGIFLTEDGQVKSLQEVDMAMGSEVITPPVDSQQIARADQAIMALRSIITLQRQRARMLTTIPQLIEARREEAEELQKKFWQWQDEMMG